MSTLCSCAQSIYIFLISSYLFIFTEHLEDFLGGSDGKEPACNAGDPSSVPGLGRSPGEGNGNSLQYSCLDNSMDKGAWQAIARGVAKSWT